MRKIQSFVSLSLVLTIDSFRSDIDESDKFLEEEILNVRLHRAKCTLPTLAQHEGFDVDASRRALRAQGGWKGKQEDLMPDSYLRSKQLLAFKLQ